MPEFTFGWNNQTSVIDAPTIVHAKTEFMERFGFWPFETICIITEKEN